MASIGPVPVPDKLVPVLPYVKAVIAVLGVVATAIAAAVPATAVPAWIYIIISVTTMLGVYTVPNGKNEL